MKRIPLTQGKFSLIDDEDYALVSCYSWYYMRVGCGYVYGRVDKKVVQLHRFLLNPPKGMEVDHINGSGLDNRRSNLRICTHSENTKNRQNPNKNNTSKHRGVYWISYIGKWGVQLRKDYKLYYFGSYSSKDDAIRVANLNIKKLFPGNI